MTEMTMEQSKRFLTSETKRWAYVIAKRNNIKVVFKKSLGRYAGQCGCSTIWYSLMTIQANLDNRKGLTDLAIHEVIHLKISDHGNDFQSEYAKWTGGDMHRYVETLKSSHHLKPVKRGSGKTLEGKFRVEWYDQGRERSKPTSKSKAIKIYEAAKSRGLSAFLYQYERVSGAGEGWRELINILPD